MYDIPAKLYSPSFDHAKALKFKIFIKGNKLARIGDGISTIFDLDAQTVTTLLNQLHRYTVESFADAHELYRKWSLTRSTETYSLSVQKTSATRVLEGQTAEEYRVLGIGHFHGRTRVAGTSIYGMVPKQPLDQVADSQTKLALRCSLPFPDSVSAVESDKTVMAVMARAAMQLSGFPILYVIETRPPAELGNVIEPTAYVPVQFNCKITHVVSIYRLAWR